MDDAIGIIVALIFTVIFTWIVKPALSYQLENRRENRINEPKDILSSSPSFDAQKSLSEAIQTQKELRSTVELLQFENGELRRSLSTLNFNHNSASLLKSPSMSGFSSDASSVQNGEGNVDRNAEKSRAKKMISESKPALKESIGIFNDLLKTTEMAVSPLRKSSTGSNLSRSSGTLPFAAHLKRESSQEERKSPTLRRGRSRVGADFYDSSRDLLKNIQDKVDTFRTQVNNEEKDLNQQNDEIKKEDEISSDLDRLKGMISVQSEVTDGQEKRIRELEFQLEEKEKHVQSLNFMIKQKEEQIEEERAKRTEEKKRDDSRINVLQKTVAFLEEQLRIAHEDGYEEDEEVIGSTPSSPKFNLNDSTGENDPIRLLSEQIEDLIQKSAKTTNNKEESQSLETKIKSLQEQINGFQNQLETPSPSGSLLGVEAFRRAEANRNSKRRSMAYNSDMLKELGRLADLVQVKDQQISQMKEEEKSLKFKIHEQTEPSPVLEPSVPIFDYDDLTVKDENQQVMEENNDSPMNAAVEFDSEFINKFERSLDMLKQVEKLLEDGGQDSNSSYHIKEINSEDIDNHLDSANALVSPETSQSSGFTSPRVLERVARSMERQAEVRASMKTRSNPLVVINPSDALETVYWSEKPGGKSFSSKSAMPERLIIEEGVDTPYFTLHFSAKDHQIFTTKTFKQDASVKKDPTEPTLIVVTPPLPEKGKEPSNYNVLVRTSDKDLLLNLSVKHQSDLFKVLSSVHPNLFPTSYRSPSATNILRKVSGSPSPILRDESFSKKLLGYEGRVRQQNFKFGVMNLRKGQGSEDEMLANNTMSQDFEDFMNLIATRVEMKDWKHYTGGLSTKGETGEFSYFAQHGGFEIMFHVAPLLPFRKNDVQQLERKRHIGNDIVVIVFAEEDSPPFNPNWVLSEMNHIYIVVSPVSNVTGVTSPNQPLSKPRIQIGDTRRPYSYEVAVVCKDDTKPFGPNLPSPPVFVRSNYFKNFLLTKLINGERAAFMSNRLKSRVSRAKMTLLTDLMNQ